MFSMWAPQVVNTYQIVADLRCDFFQEFMNSSALLTVLLQLKSWQTDTTPNLDQGVDDLSVSQWCREADACTEIQSKQEWIQIICN